MIYKYSPKDIKQIIKNVTNNYYDYFDKLYEVNKFLERHKLSKLTLGEIDILVALCILNKLNF